MEKVLFFINNLTHGGAEKALVNLLNNLDRTKYDITLLVLFNDGVNKKFLNTDIKYKFIFNKTFRANTYALKVFTPSFLYKTFIKEDYDIVISYLEGVTARILSGCSNENTKKISWHHTEYLNQNQFAYPVFRNIKEAKKSYQSFDAIVGVSKLVTESFSKVSGINKNLNVLYNTIETEKIGNLALESVDISFSVEKINVITMGRLTKVKGYIRLLKIVNRLVAENIIDKNFHLYILGIGEDEKDLNSFILNNNLTSYVSLLGYQENPYKYVAKCDLFVCSSYREGFSTAVTESLVVGTPVITTLCSGMEELLGENNDYGIITSNTGDDLYEGLKQVLTDSELLSFYKQKAIERGEYFNLNKTVKSVEAFLNNV